jgi:hypothetical protein
VEGEKYRKEKERGCKGVWKGETEKNRKM